MSEKSTVLPDISTHITLYIDFPLARLEAIAQRARQIHIADNGEESAADWDSSKAAIMQEVCGTVVLDALHRLEADLGMSFDFGG